MADKALADMEVPQVKWKAVMWVALALVLVWITAFMAVPVVNYWGVGVAALVTVVVLGFGIYLYRMIKKNQNLMGILKNASSPEGRKLALEQLQAQSSDAMAALARAQLLAQDSPQEALKALEAIDIAKAPALVQDDVRANLALMYLSTGRVKEARRETDLIKYDKQPNPKAKAMYIAVCAESLARTGAGQEAKKIIQSINATDPSYAEVRILLHRAEVFAFTASNNKGLAKKAMHSLATIQPEAVGVFLQKGSSPELVQLAKETLTEFGAMPRMKMQIQRR